jgi:predicted flap endonuclease-1-like 5' DNA nuclease
MIYLISILWPFLLATMAFAGVAAWAFATERAAPQRRANRRDRENLLSDILRLSGEPPSGEGALQDSRELDGLRRQLELRDGRITELERALETSRERAHDLAGQIAELQRHGVGDSDDGAELARLRGLVSDYEAERARTIDVETAPEPAQEPAPVAQMADDEIALQGWRLRYFEQRVRYLETRSAAPQALTAVAPVAEAPVAEQPLAEWRAREAEARALHLEAALREATAAPVSAVPFAAPVAEPEPFAADADVDVLLRWRLLYLERRVAHLQAQAPAAAAEPIAAPAPVAQPVAAVAGPDPDRWKWRARYLEARVRHLEQRISAAQAVAQRTVQTLASGEAPAEAPGPTPPRRRGVKPPVLGSARNGAPDDLTLIEGVSPLNHSTLNALGIFHFDQIAAWTPDHVAWVDAYLRLQGRIEEEEWLDQAQALAEEGPAAARRIDETVD